MSAIYNLFLRQWKRKRITKNDLEDAVDRGLITKDEKQEIMSN